MLDTKFERFNGDIGNAQTWPFPVQYKIVHGAVPNKVVDTLNNRDLFQRFADAADELIAEGVDGITTTCGFLALYQQELAAHCSVPVATSALLQVPMVARMLPKGKRPGDPDVLGRVADRPSSRGCRHRSADAGRRLAADVGFQRSIREGDASVPFEVLKDEVLGVARQMVENDPSIGAIVCECTNITPYSHDLSRRPRRARLRHGHAGALVSSRAAAGALSARLIASGSGLTGGCVRRRPAVSSGTPSVCAVNSAAARPQKRPWHRPMPHRVIAFRRLTSVGPNSRADRARKSPAETPSQRQTITLSASSCDRFDGPREGLREAALEAAQSRDLSPQARAVDAGDRDLEIIEYRAGRKRAGERGRLRAADGGAIAGNDRRLRRTGHRRRRAAAIDGTPDRSGTRRRQARQAASRA